ncbi:hypothetical protein [Streptomyces fodineus]|uniref:hypothetical protein n=1 Tax=Streptomyces fodineus TaxID=1904616 RepID=UPI000B0CFD52
MNRTTIGGRRKRRRPWTRDRRPRQDGGDNDGDTDGRQAWEAAREGLVSLWRRFQPERAEAVAGELDAARDDLLLAQRSGDTDTEAELTAEWQARVRRLLAARPEVAEELRRVLAELAPQLPDQRASAASG